jgi:hypothetical protein
MNNQVEVTLPVRVARIMKGKPRGAFVVGKVRIPWDDFSMVTEVVESIRRELKSQTVTTITII